MSAGDGSQELGLMSQILEQAADTFAEAIIKKPVKKSYRGCGEFATELLVMRHKIKQGDKDLRLEDVLHLQSQINNFAGWS